MVIVVVVFALLGLVKWLCAVLVWFSLLVESKIEYSGSVACEVRKLGGVWCYKLRADTTTSFSFLMIEQ